MKDGEDATQVFIKIIVRIIWRFLYFENKTLGVFNFDFS
jgi:hypothetical protein